LAGRAASFLSEVDEITSDRNLSSNVAELRPDTQEQIVLFSQWARVVFCDFDFLNTHIGIRDFGHWSKEEEDYQESDEAGYTKICPLHVLKASCIVDSVGEEHT